METKQAVLPLSAPVRTSILLCFGNRHNHITVCDETIFVSSMTLYQQAGHSYIQMPFLRCKMLVGIVPNPLCTASAGCRLRICAKCFYNEKDHRGLSQKAGAILGGLCLSGLRFFLGSLFFGEKHLYILLCFHQFLHLIPRLAVGWISGFLL